jgi:hypothetical protein
MSIPRRSFSGTRWRELARSIPFLRPAIRLRRRILNARLRRLARRGEVWEHIYRKGGTSGPGSYGRLAEFKAEVLNSFVAREGVESVIELGCGDGHQLSLANYPSYFGLDISPSAIRICEERFRLDPSKHFQLYDPKGTPPKLARADLAISLEVIFHIFDDDVFARYMRLLFDCSNRFVIVYSSNTDRPWHGLFVRHRHFTRWVDENIRGWQLIDQVRNRYPHEEVGDENAESWSDFFFYGRNADHASHGEPAL